jgi:hypothetical protein
MKNTKRDLDLNQATELFVKTQNFYREGLLGNSFPGGTQVSWKLIVKRNTVMITEAFS